MRYSMADSTAHFLHQDQTPTDFFLIVSYYRAQQSALIMG